VSKSLSPASRNYVSWGLPLLLFVVALGLRLIGIGWGLPNDKHTETYHPDEAMIWSYSQHIDPVHLEFTPGFYNYGTLYLTALNITSDMTAAYTGGYDTQKPETIWQYIGRCELAGRILSAIAGAGMALVVFFMLRRLVNDFGATCGALCVAFAPGHVVHSRFQTVDILAAFLLTVSAFYALQFATKDGETPKRSDVKLAILSGVFAGLSAGTKYTGVLCLVTLFTVLILTRRTNWVRLFLIGIGCALLAFLITTPGAILDNANFLRDFIFEMQHTSEGHGLVFEGTSSGFIYQLSNLFLGIGIILSLMGMGGLAAAGIRKHAWAIGLAAFFVLYYLLIGRAEVKFLRYTFPLYLGIGVGFGWLMAKAREKGEKWHLLVGLGILGLGGVDMGGLRGAALYTSWMAAPDPRDAAGDYLRGKDVAIGVATDPWFYSPSFHPDLGRRLDYSPQSGIGNHKFEHFLPAILQYTQPKIDRYIPVENGLVVVKDRTDWDIRLLEEQKPDYVVYSSFETENLENLSHGTNLSPTADAIVRQWKAFLDKLRVDYAPDRQFGPGGEIVHDMMYVQPTIWVWKRKGTP